jgi:hypothetical protein
MIQGWGERLNGGETGFFGGGRVSRSQWWVDPRVLLLFAVNAFALCELLPNASLLICYTL